MEAKPFRWQKHSNQISSCMDLNIPGSSGMAATREIVKANPHIRILMVTMFEDDESVFAALRAGAQGVCLKGHR